MELFEVKFFCNEFIVMIFILIEYGGFMNELFSVVCLNDDEIWICGNSIIFNFYNFKVEF